MMIIMISTLLDKKQQYLLSNQINEVINEVIDEVIVSHYARR